MRLVTCLLIALMLMIAPLLAQSEKIDLSTIKCKAFPENVKDRLPMILLWLDGRYKKKEEAPIIDTTKFGQTIERLAKYCRDNPEVGLIIAADRTLAR